MTADRTPRTLSECRWTTGYPRARVGPSPETKFERAASGVLAVVLGIVIAASGWHWLAS